jgi:hypothetical protein
MLRPVFPKECTTMYNIIQHLHEAVRTTQSRMTTGVRSKDSHAPHNLARRNAADCSRPANDQLQEEDAAFSGLSQCNKEAVVLIFCS